MFLGRQLFLLLLVALCCDVQAQEPDTCLRRTVPVIVMDRNGNLIPGLSAESFRAQLGGQPIRVGSVTEAAIAGRVFILLDSSGSMLEPEAGWIAALTVIRQFIQNAPGSTALALAHHTTKIEEMVGFDQPREALLRKLEELQTGSKTLPRKPTRRTALADVLVEAVDRLGPTHAGDTILAVSDGESNRDVNSDGKVRDALTRAGVRLFVVFQRGVAWEIERQFGSLRVARDVFGIDGMIRFRELALSTGGNTFSLYPNAHGKYEFDEINVFVPGADSRFPPKVSLERLWRQAVTFYRVELELPARIPKPKKWRLDVVEASGKTKKDVLAHFPKQLAACALGN